MRRTRCIDFFLIYIIIKFIIQFVFLILNLFVHLHVSLPEYCSDNSAVAKSIWHGQGLPCKWVVESQGVITLGFVAVVYLLDCAK